MRRIFGVSVCCVPVLVLGQVVFNAPPPTQAQLTEVYSKEFCEVVKNYMDGFKWDLDHHAELRPVNAKPGAPVEDAVIRRESLENSYNVHRILYRDHCPKRR
jgi:hypothetical protein